MLRHSKSLTKYCIHAKSLKTAKSLKSRYGTTAWAMILNSTDSLGNAYCHHLGGAGFNLILCGPPIDLDRMQGQASILKNHYKVRIQVLVVDYHNLSVKLEETYQEIAAQLEDCDICILINNQAYSVPFDYARADLLNQTIQSCVAQINKHINCSLLIQQLIVPKMLNRHEYKKLRSAILTLKTSANALFEQQMAQTLKFPILRSAMAFNSTLTSAMRQQYQGYGIDIMQAFAPFVSFESWLKHGLVLEVVMQERLLAAHVRSVLNHLMQGYDESHGSQKEALYRNFHMRYLSPNGAFQTCLFERYAEMSEDRRFYEFEEDQRETSKQVQAKTILPPVVKMCDQIVQTQIDLESFRQMISARDVDDDGGNENFEWTELSDMEEIYEEDSYKFEPVEGDKLEFESKRRIWQAEMSLNKKSLLEANKMSQETLLEMVTTGKPVTIASKLQEKMKNLAVIASVMPKSLEEVRQTKVSIDKVGIEAKAQSLEESQSTAAESLQNSQLSISHGKALSAHESVVQAKASEIKKSKVAEVQKVFDAPLNEEVKIVVTEPLSQPADDHAKKEQESREYKVQAQREQAELVHQIQAVEAERQRVHVETVANQKLLETEEAKRAANKAAEAAEKERLEIEEAQHHETVAAITKLKFSEEDAAYERAETISVQAADQESNIHAQLVKPLEVEPLVIVGSLRHEKAQTTVQPLEPSQSPAAESLQNFQSNTGHGHAIPAQESVGFDNRNKKSRNSEPLESQKIRETPLEVAGDLIMVSETGPAQAVEQQSQALLIQQMPLHTVEPLVLQKNIQHEQISEIQVVSFESRTEQKSQQEMGYQDIDAKPHQGNPDNNRTSSVDYPEQTDDPNLNQAPIQGKQQVNNTEQNVKKSEDLATDYEKPIQRHMNTMSFSDPSFVPLIHALEQTEENMNEKGIDEKQQVSVIQAASNRVQTPQPRVLEENKGSSENMVAKAGELEVKGSDHSSQPTNDTNSGSSRGGKDKKGATFSSSFNPKSMEETKPVENNDKKALQLAPETKVGEELKQEVTPRKSVTPEMKKPETMEANPFFDKLSPIDNKINEPKQRGSIDSPEFKTTSVSPRSSIDKNLKVDSDFVESSSKSPSPQKFIAVKTSTSIAKPSVGSLNKSNRDASGSVVSRDSNEEWKQTPVKEINQVSQVSLIKNMRKMQSENTQNISPKIASSESSQFQIEDDGIQICTKSLRTDNSPLTRSISERQFEESSGSNDEAQVKKALAQQKIIDYEKFATAPNSGRVNTVSDPLVSNRENNLSSSSDMRELKLALAGKSDRSGNGQGLDQKTSMLEIEGEIFSDAESSESFDLDKYEDEQEQIWQKAAKEVKKASLQFCRGITKRMKKGDEVDQAFGSVLNNFINSVLTHDSNSVENDQNLTEIQKLEKQNLHLINELATCLPYVKLSPGRYLIGTEIRSVQIKGRGLLVRTGGGFMYLNEFCQRYAKNECLKMALLMLKTHSNYKTCVVSLLKKHQNTTTAQKDFIRKCPSEIDQQFSELVDKVRIQEAQIQKMKNRKSFNAPFVSKEDALNMSMHSQDNKRKTLFTPGVTKLLIYKSPSPTPGRRVPSSARSPGRTYPNTFKHSNDLKQRKDSLNNSMQFPAQKSQNTSLIEKKIKKLNKEKYLNNSQNDSGPIFSSLAMSTAMSSLFPPVKSKMIKRQKATPNKDIQTSLATSVMAGRPKAISTIKLNRPDALASSPVKKLQKSSTTDALASPAKLQKSTAHLSPKK